MRNVDTNLLESSEIMLGVFNRNNLKKKCTIIKFIQRVFIIGTYVKVFRVKFEANYELIYIHHSLVSINTITTIYSYQI